MVRPKPAPLLFYSVERQTILLVNGESLGGKGLSAHISPSYTGQNHSNIILLCLMPDDFTRRGRASEWERVITRPMALFEKWLPFNYTFIFI